MQEARRYLGDVGVAEMPAPTGGVASPSLAMFPARQRARAWTFHL